MLNWLRTTTETTRKEMATQIGRFRNRGFMEAIAAACAMIAASDGSVSSEEKQKMVGFMQRSDELKVFDIKEVIAAFNKFVENFEFDTMIGEAEALKVIGRMRDNADQARLLVRVACMIGASDGNFDENERVAAGKIAKELGLNPTEFDL